MDYKAKQINSFRKKCIYFIKKVHNILINIQYTLPWCSFYSTILNNLKPFKDTLKNDQFLSYKKSSELEEVFFFIDFFKFSALIGIFLYLPFEIIIQRISKQLDFLNLISALIWFLLNFIFAFLLPFLLSSQINKKVTIDKKITSLRIIFLIINILAPIFAFEYYIVYHKINSFFPSNEFTIFWTTNHFFLMNLPLIIFVRKHSFQLGIFFLLYTYFCIRVNIADFKNWGEVLKTILFAIYLISIIAVFLSFREREIKENFENYNKMIKLSIEWKNVCSSLPQSVLIISKNEKLLYFSNKFEKLKEKTNIELDNMNKVRDFFEKSDVNLVYNQNYNNLNQFDFNLESVFTECELKFERNSLKENNYLNFLIFPEGNNEIVLEMKVIPIEFELSESFLFLIEDISEKNLINILKANNEFKNRLLNSFSHELKTPLNGASTPLQTCLLDPETPEKLKKNYLNTIKNSLEFLECVINDIIDLGYIMNDQFKLFIEKLNIKEIAEETIEIIRHLTNIKDLKLHIEIEDNINEINNDKLRIKQVMLNILRNAVKFTNKGKSYIQVEIQDTGIGMKQEKQEELKKILFLHDLTKITSVNLTGGGLGLIISQNIAKNIGPKEHGITFISEFEKGSTFSFFIENKTKKIETNNSISFDVDNFEENRKCIDFSPYNYKYNFNSFDKIEKKIKIIEKSEENVELLDKIDFKSPRILIVDDESFNLLALEMIIKSSFTIEIEKAYDGLQAVEIVENFYSKNQWENCEGFKLIIMDLQMPKMNGIEATKCLKKLEKKKKIPVIPIIACTAFNSKDDVNNCFEVGMVDFVCKPVSKVKLTKIINSYLN